ncbi:3-isopropylmalate dehydratase large subunit [Rhynchospora pubera]|uniref:3-isopropylmalate dehydratase large subunit n=1 Tax=Rhynchospora pubera TaxID=906938 RepID=A0AAV8DQU2_9POAL|nr:3-isopropylmalate dehydratase large subunit [Rhynchospora pubera]
MEGGVAQIALPVLGIVAAAAATFYIVSFMELREQSFRALDDLDDEGTDEFKSLVSSRERRARRKPRSRREPKK